MDDHQHHLFWVGSSKKDLKAMPAEVQDVFGYALHLAQHGKKHVHAKPLKGFSGAGVLEVVEDYAGNAFRAVYMLSFGNAVYVLHCYQKKSTHGIQTPKRDTNLIKQRLKLAYLHIEESHHERH